RQDGVWKISKLHFYTKFYAPYEGGWTRAPKESALRYGKSNVRPTRPTSVKYEPYPARFTPPFHFGNPVKTSYRFGGPGLPASAGNGTADAQPGARARSAGARA